MLPRVHCLAILTLAALLAAAKPATRPAVDLSTPRSALNTFADALQHGDVPTAMAVSLNDAVSTPLVETMVKFSGTQQKLLDAAAARWGEEVRHMVKPDFVSELQQLAETKVELQGPLARFTRDDPTPVLLRKSPEGWKVDARAMAKGVDVLQDMQAYNAMAVLEAEVTKEITSGKKRSMATVMKTLDRGWATMREVAKSSSPHATTTPSP